MIVKFGKDGEITMEYKINSCNYNIKDLIRIIIQEFNIDYWDKWLEKQDYKSLMKKPNIFVSCEENNRLIGICSIKICSNKNVYLNSFYVLKEYRNKGIGTKLYKICENCAKTSNHQRIDLVVDPHFKEAIEFYKKKNYIYDYYDEERKELHYHKNIEGVNSNEKK